MKFIILFVIWAHICTASILPGAIYGGSQQVSSVEHSESSSVQSSSGISGIGGVGGYGGASSISKRTSSYSSVSSTSSVNIYEQWPQLGGIPWFQQVCGLASNYKSAGIASQLITSDFSFESTFTELYTKNQFLEQYIWAATGIRYDSATLRSKFFSIVQQNPGTFLRILNNFARHPSIFQSKLGQLLITKTSVEIFQSYTQESAIQYFQTGYGINKLLEYKSYRVQLASVFGVAPEVNLLRAYLKKSYLTNSLGTLLLIRHILTRKTLYTYNEYTSFNYESYSSSYASRQIWKHNPYYEQFYQSSTTETSSVGTTGLGYGAVAGASSYKSASYESTSVSSSSSGVSGIGGIGGIGGYAGSVSKSSYSSVSSTSIVDQWPQLGSNPWFAQVAGLASNYKSAVIANQLITSGFNFESTLSELYSKNQFLEQYIWATTGIRYNSVTLRSKFYSIIQQNPGSFLRSLQYFARHPGIFQSQLGQTLISTTSVELFQSYNQQSALSFFQSGYGINQFLEYSSYRTSLASVFGVQPEISVLRSILTQAYQRNAVGTLLLFRHIITRKKLYSINEYLGFNYQVYSSKYVNQKIWRHNPYYDSFYGSSATEVSSVSSVSSVGSTGLGIGGLGAATAASSYQESSYQSKSASVGAAGLGYGGIGGSSYQSSSYQKTSVSQTSVASQWPQLGTVPFFQQVAGLASNYKSAAIASQLISSDFDFYSTFSDLYGKNSFLERYISAATGIRVSTVETRRSFFSIVQRNPGTFLKILRNFARRPAIYQSQLAQTVIAKTSVEIFQSFSTQSALQLFQPGYGINKFFESSSYRSTLAEVLGVSSEISIVSSAFQQYYQQNPLGSLLLIRHILTNRQLYSLNEYIGFDYEIYSSRYASQRSWIRNPYYEAYNSQYSSTSVRSSSFSSRGAGYGRRFGGGTFGGASSYKASRASSRSVRSVRGAGC